MSNLHSQRRVEVYAKGGKMARHYSESEGNLTIIQFLAKQNVHD